ncbi:MAG: hypothetical protein NT161_03075 [Candidatus Nomurabacteria bacterium]|nr:hypothetical protein [Candidatus Nomurabacteria bacterium]
MKNKTQIPVAISILIILSCVGVIYLYLNGSRITTPWSMSEFKAIKTIKDQFPELRGYPSDNLPPKSIKTEKANDGWYVAFIQEGSGKPIIGAKCFFVNSNEGVVEIDKFDPSINDTTLNISPKTCKATLPNDDQTEKPTPSSFGNDQVEKAITDYLLTQKYFSWKTTNDSRNFCVIENLNPTENGLFPLYVWVRCGEFIMQNGKLKELSGLSVPTKIDYPNQLSFYDISKFSYEVPRDGSLYSKDIKTIFPLNAQNRIADFNSKNINKNIETTVLNGLKK